VLIADAHLGYISWQQYEEIDQRLRQNTMAYGIDRSHGPARKGPALLQGRVVCGICGNRMTVRFRGGATTTLNLPLPFNARL
jgi:hypothetical protein